MSHPRWVPTAAVSPSISSLRSRWSLHAWCWLVKHFAGLCFGCLSAHQESSSEWTACYSSGVSYNAGEWLSERLMKIIFVFFEPNKKIEKKRLLIRGSSQFYLELGPPWQENTGCEHLSPLHLRGGSLKQRICVGGRIGKACGSIFIMHILLWVVGRYFQCAVFLSFIEFLDLVVINIWE